MRTLASKRPIGQHVPCSIMWCPIHCSSRMEGPPVPILSQQRDVPLWQGSDVHALAAQEFKPAQTGYCKAMEDRSWRGLSGRSRANRGAYHPSHKNAQMPFSRRQLLAITSLTVASGIAGSSRGAGAPIRAIAFDGFPIFDPRRRLRLEARGDSLCRVRRLGRLRLKAVRLSHLLGQQAEATARAAGGCSRR